MIDATSGGTITWSSAFLGSNFTTFGEDISGQLYVAGRGSGIVSKVIDTSLGVNTFEKGALQLYPNPATSEVYIKSGMMAFPASASISDITGKLIITQSLESESQAIGTSALQSGIYLVSIKDNLGANYISKLTIK